MEARFEFTLDPIKQCDKLKAGLRNKAIRIAMNKAASKVKAQVIANAPSKTGALKKSIRIKIKNYRNKNLWVAIVGASNNYKRTRKKISIYPTKYAKLVERGTKHMSAKPYLKPALTQTQQAYMDTLTESIRTQVEQILGSQA